MTAHPCARPVLGTDVVGTPCPSCGHTDLLHPGRPNATLRACLVCELLTLRDRLRDELGEEVTTVTFPSEEDLEEMRRANDLARCEQIEATEVTDDTPND